MSKKEYHQSTLNSFELCGWKFCLRFIQKRRGVVTPFLIKGNSAHKARAYNLAQKVKTRQDLKPDEIADIARDEVVRAFDEGGIELRASELKGKPIKLARSILIDQSNILARRDLVLQRRIQPKEVEATYVVKLEDWPFDLGLTVDSTSEDGYIDDLKTSRKRLSQAQADEGYQPSVYLLGYRAAYGKDAEGFRYHVLTQTKKNLYAYELITNRTDADIKAVLNRFYIMHKAIKAGHFPPASRGSWICSPKWCEFFYECKYVKG